MKPQSIFKLVFTGAFITTIALSSCENNDNTRDSNSEKTEGDVNDPTKYNNSGSSNQSTRTGGSMSLNDEGEKASDLVSENSPHQTKKNQNTNNNSNSDMNTSRSGTDLGGTSSGTKNVTLSGSTGSTINNDNK